MGNDIAIYGGRLYAVINCSNKVEVMDKWTARRIGQIDIPNCRYIKFDGGYAYVTSYAGPVVTNNPNYDQIGYVAKVDTATLQVMARCEVGFQPDELEIVNGRMYVANSGGYMSDVIRGGIEGVDQGQTEAARSLGMSKGQTMFHIIIPQAVKNILPAVANEFVTIIKESSVCYTIGVQDIMFNVKSIQSASFIIAEPLLMATFLYFCLCFPTSKIIQYFERRMRASDQR